MEKKRKRRNKSEYKKWVWEYSKRIEKMQAHLTDLHYKRNIWKKQIIKMEKKEAQIIALGNAIAMFTGYNIKGSIKNTSEEFILARRIFFKYGLENGMEGKALCIYVGVNWATSKDVARNNRKVFTKSFETTPSNRVLYTRFKEHYENNIENEGDIIL